MVLQQCLACNSVKTDSCTSCACGHVFEHCKLIGGKRFSEYRVELYSRLESRRVKRLTREKSKETENTKQTRQKKPRDFKSNRSVSHPTKFPPSHFFKGKIKSGPYCRRPQTRSVTDQTSAAMHLPLKQRTQTPSQSVNRRMKTKPFPRTTGSTASKTSLPPELVSRLPNALQEINRRLTGQNLMWWTVRWLQ